METIDVDDVSYGCRVWQQHDNLPFLLMLHGFMGDKRVFEHIAVKLASSCNPVTVDLLGHGDSSLATDPRRFDEKRQVGDLIKLIDKLNIAPLYLYGYSMGGRLALKTALAASHLFLGIMLESTNFGISDPEKRRVRAKKDEQRARQIETDFKEFLSAWEQNDLFKSSLPRDPKLEKKYKTIQAEQYPDSMAASLRGFGTGKMEPETGPFRDFLKPVLLLTGSDDHKYLDIGTRLSKMFPLVRLCRPEGGHRVHLDNPGECCRELVNFIDLNHTNRPL